MKITSCFLLLAAGSTWKYSDTGASPGANWATAEFGDDAWSKGAAQLGYGDRDEATPIDASKDNYPRYYFRQQFEVEDPGKLKPLVVRLLKDDGAIVYLNGKEVVRDNMPDGKVTHDTFAKAATPIEAASTSTISLRTSWWLGRTSSRWKCIRRMRTRAM
ncbi:MAG: hypothetical protein ACI8XO_000700 [Verrucomicrobiales bacterium]|jgi:hypothetical protein